MDDREGGVVGDLGELLGDQIGLGRSLVLDEEHRTGGQRQLGNVLGIGEVLDELDDGFFLGRIALLGGSQEGLNGGHKTALALAAFVLRVHGDFAVVGEEDAVLGVVFLVEVGDPPRTVEVNGGVAGQPVAVHVAGAGGDGAVKGVVIHFLEDLGSLHKGGILQAVGIYVLAADGLDDQGVPQHGAPAVLAGHLAHGVVAVVLGVLAELEELVIGGGEMIPADLGKDLGVVDRGEDGGLEGQEADLAVDAPRVIRALGKILAPALGEVGSQIHELAGLGVGLDIISGIEDAEVGGVAGGDGRAQLVAGRLIVGLLLDDDLDLAGVLGVELLDQLFHVGSLGVGSDPDAGEVDGDLLLGLGLLAAGAEREDHRECKQQCESFFHFGSPFPFFGPAMPGL